MDCLSRNPQLGDLWRIPAEGGVAERLTHDNADIRGWSWLPDGSGLIFGRRVDSEARLYRLDLRDHSLHDVGVDDAQAPDVAHGHLVFVQRKPQFGVYQVIGDTMNGGYIRRRLFPSSGRDDQPMIAPDGRQLIFASNRSGAYGLWWGDVSKPGSVRLIEGLRPDSRQAADWSADSQRVLVSGSDAAGHAALFEVTPVAARWCDCLCRSRARCRRSIFPTPTGCWCLLLPTTGIPSQRCTTGAAAHGARWQRCRTFRNYA